MSLTSLSFRFSPLVVASLAMSTAMAQLPTFPGLDANQFRSNPDTSIAAGANFLVQTVNSEIAVYNKSTTIRLAHNNLNGPGIFPNAQGFFEALGGTRIVNTRVVYDHQRDRYGLVGLQIDSGFTTGTQGIYVAWSKSGTFSNQNGTSNDWWRFRTPQPMFGSATPGMIVNAAAGVNGLYRADYNGLGVNGNYLVYSGNLEPVTPSTGPNVQFHRRFDINSLDGGPVSFQDTFFFDTSPVELAQPCHDLDGSGNVVLAGVSDPALSNQFQIELYQYDNLVPNRNVTVPGYQLPGVAGGNFVPQGPNPLSPTYPNPPLDSGDGRATQAVMRDGRAFVCHTVVVPSGTFPPQKQVVRWYDIDLNGWPGSFAQPTLVQTGDIDLGSEVGGQPISTFVGGITCNSDGIIAIGYTRSSSVRRPEIAMSFHSLCAPLGTTVDDPLTAPIFSSVFPFSGTGTPERWGDWATMAIDGLDERVIWTCGETSLFEATTPGTPKWGTVIHRRPLFNAGTSLAVTSGTSFPSNFTLSSNILPRIGSQPVLSINHGSTSGLNGLPALLWIGFGGLVPGIPTGSGGFFHIDQALPNTSVFVLLNSTPSTSTPFQLDLPMDPGFVGVNQFFQVLAADQANTIYSTNLLNFTLGC